MYCMDLVHKLIYFILVWVGHRLKGRDVLHGGIATHLIGKEKVRIRPPLGCCYSNSFICQIPSLLSDLTESCDDPVMKKDPHYVVKSILDKYHKEVYNHVIRCDCLFIFVLFRVLILMTGAFPYLHTQSSLTSIHVHDFLCYSLSLSLYIRCFSGGSVEDIQMSLLNDGSDWSINQLQVSSLYFTILC